MNFEGTPLFPQRWMNERKGYEEFEAGASLEQYAFALVLAGLASNPALVGTSPEEMVSQARALVKAGRFGGSEWEG